MTWPFGDMEPGSFDCLVVDPPWAFSSNSKTRPGRNAMRHYDCMSMDDICALPVADLAAEDSLLWLWITGPFLALGAHVPIMKAWGFKPSGMGFTWIKLNRRAGGLFLLPNADLHHGTGFTTRKNAEFVVIGRKGKTGHLRKSNSVHEVIFSTVREHSRKPDEAMNRIRQYVGPDARIAELFAREQRPGVTAWGHETGKFNGASE